MSIRFNQAFKVQLKYQVRVISFLHLYKNYKMKSTLFAVLLILSPPVIQKLVLHSLLYTIEHTISLDILSNVYSGSKASSEIEG